jgi:hypothetical protein
MSELNMTDAIQAQAAHEAANQGESKPAQRATTDPREVAAVVVTRLRQVHAKKDELAVAIDALADITRQLTRSYAAQIVAVEQLRKRVQLLEAPPAAARNSASESLR